jgi:hypothetical protein
VHYLEENNAQLDKVAPLKRKEEKKKGKIYFAPLKYDQNFIYASKILKVTL